MNILLTGAGSFTGYWFAAALRKAGHLVVAPLRQPAATADALRTERLRQLAAIGVVLHPDCSFGSPRFLDLVGNETFDVICLHGAEVGDYRSPDFDIAGALSKNTHNLRPVLQTLAKREPTPIVLTGSIFEAGEGVGSDNVRAFSAYAVSKGLTSTLVSFVAGENGIPVRKFTIPNPFGPLEQPRLGAYLAKSWQNGEVAEIRTPAYVRDNIPVDLLAAAYVRFVCDPEQRPKLNPSGYVEAQGAFVERVAREMRMRSGLECRFTLANQRNFDEPHIRINTDVAARYVPEWEETASWDAYATAIALV